MKPKAWVIYTIILITIGLIILGPLLRKNMDVVQSSARAGVGISLLLFYFSLYFAPITFGIIIVFGVLMLYFSTSSTKLPGGNPSWLLLLGLTLLVVSCPVCVILVSLSQR